MAEDKSPWMNWMALTTVIMAVCATLATGKSGGFSTHAVLEQSQASDQWAYYQAKGVKENLNALEIERIHLRLDSEVLTVAEQRALTAYLQKIEARKNKYALQKKQISAKALALEAERDKAQNKGKPFGQATVILQIAIMLSSIAGLLKKKWLWGVGVLTGIVGAVMFLNGFLLFL